MSSHGPSSIREWFSGHPRAVVINVLFCGHIWNKWEAHVLSEACEARLRQDDRLTEKGGVATFGVSDQTEMVVITRYAIKILIGSYHLNVKYNAQNVLSMVECKIFQNDARWEPGRFLATEREIDSWMHIMFFRYGFALFAAFTLCFTRSHRIQFQR
jgi:hypothetical protein